MSSVEALSLWNKHLAEPFPAGCAGVEIKGIDLVLLDSEAAGILEGWVTSGGGRVPEAQRAVLAQCTADIARVLADLDDPAARGYFDRLKRLAHTALEA